jgi:hypothetical protein
MLSVSVIYLVHLVKVIGVEVISLDGFCKVKTGGFI